MGSLRGCAIHGPLSHDGTGKHWMKTWLHRTPDRQTCNGMASNGNPDICYGRKVRGESDGLVDMNLLVDAPLPGRFMIASGFVLHGAMELSIFLGCCIVQRMVPGLHLIDLVVLGNPAFRRCFVVIQ